MISIQNITKAFGREILFKEINLTIHNNERIALVGQNGSGKTTFLKCLTGQENFEGNIILNDTKISLMEQEKDFDNLEKTFNDYIKDKTEELEKQKQEIEKQMGDPAFYESEESFTKLLEKYNLLVTSTSFQIEQHKLIKTLNELEINEEILNQKISELSGGQKIKLRLAECLSKKADLYLLDEPTNHLDLKSCEWIENYIQENMQNLIVISHDKYFLDKITTRVFEIEDQKIKDYQCGFKKYEEKKLEDLESQREKYKDTERRRTSLMESSKERRRWASIATSKKQRIMADRLEENAKKIEKVSNPDEFIKEININFSNKSLHNCDIFRLIGVGKKFDKITLLEDINQIIEQGEKICIIGKNGTGKSIFIKMLAGIESATSGEIEKRKDLSIGYFDQELKDINQNQTIISFIVKETGKPKESLYSQLLKFNFSKEDIQKKINQLSGGEKARLNILRLTMKSNSILLLDEPTNNLDINLKNSLAKAVKQFPGTILYISHDRQFINETATKIYEIKNKKINSYSGNYSDYLENAIN